MKNRIIDSVDGGFPELEKGKKFQTKVEGGGKTIRMLVSLCSFVYSWTTIRGSGGRGNSMIFEVGGGGVYRERTHGNGGVRSKDGFS